MGIRPGILITKVSGQRLRGPVTARVGRSHIAMGHGMASKVVVSAARKVSQ
jgi:ferrous iron transport protein A